MDTELRGGVLPLTSLHAQLLQVHRKQPRWGRRSGRPRPSAAGPAPLRCGSLKSCERGTMASDRLSWRRETQPAEMSTSGVETAAQSPRRNSRCVPETQVVFSHSTARLSETHLSVAVPHTSLWFKVCRWNVLMSVSQVCSRQRVAAARGSLCPGFRLSGFTALLSDWRSYLLPERNTWLKTKNTSMIVFSQDSLKERKEAALRRVEANDFYLT